MAYLKNSILVLCLVLFGLPFAFYAVDRGLSVADLQEQSTSRLYHSEALIASWSLYAHMVAGGIITVLAPLQLFALVRNRWPLLHRLSGYLIACCALLTASAGLLYIAVLGTIGGLWMSMGFALYGVLMVWVTAKTVSLARAREPMHQVWAERLVILALASWIYRVHYGVWEVATGGVATMPDFTGAFDRVQVFAFYVPYLVLHAWWRQRHPPRW